MGEADRLHRMCAPASAVVVDGGVGAQKSSQISAAKVKPSIPSPQKPSSVPNGTSWSPIFMVRPLRLIPEANQRRSEEHTSDLQSLMRLSYAVSCLNTKN